MTEELTLDKCVLVHCDSKAEDADVYRANSLAFLTHWDCHHDIVVCVNAGIRQEYATFPAAGAAWWKSVISQSRYRDKKRCIKRAKRQEFCTKRKTHVHDEDFDYIDAASQSSSLMWITNEAT